MNPNVPELLILTFARSNPVFFSHILEAVAKVSDQRREVLASRVLAFTSPSAFLGYGGAVGPAAKALQKIYADQQLPLLGEVYHAFPVWSEAVDCGLMVPVSIEPSEDWHVSDAFGAFGFLGGEGGRPLTGLLKKIEEQWAVLYNGEVLPLRWRRAFSLRVLCPVHLEAISGESLHVPLIIALVRALATSIDSGVEETRLPFGNLPVFATGRLGRDGKTFQAVKHVEEKLAGFIREYGEGLPALLQREQIDTLSSGLLAKVVITRVDSLIELLAVPEIATPLAGLAGSVHLTEVDALLGLMSRQNRSVRFNDVEALAYWLQAHVNSPVYRFHLHRQCGFIHTHNGKLLKAFRQFACCDELISEWSDCFGLVDRCDLAIARGVLAIEGMDPKPAVADLEQLASSEAFLPLGRRVAYWGTRCQLHRVAGADDLAVHSGEKAVALADLGQVSDSGRDRNYLIHALLARAKKAGGSAGQPDLVRAAELCRESGTVWAPRDNVYIRRSHLTFCLHYQAELARLQSRPYRLAESPPWKGHWGHAWYFALLSCARNPAHDMALRREHVEKLVRGVAAITEKAGRDSLFFLFLQVYAIYRAALFGEVYDEPFQLLRRWCDSLARQGLPGWQDQLFPLFARLEQNESEVVEELCDAIPYH